VTVGLAAAACNASPSPRGAGGAPVLGQQRGTPAVVGQPAPAATGQLDAVSCASSDLCWAVGTPASQPVASPSSTAPSPSDAVIVATANGGRTWVAQPVALTSTLELDGISCPDVRHCMAVGSAGAGSSTAAVLTTEDGGAHWTQVAPPAGAIVVTGVDCIDAVSCTAIADDGTAFWSAQSTDFGRSWQREGDLPAVVEDPGGLSCALDGTCLITGFTPTAAGHGQGAIATSSDGGATWTASQVPAGTGLLQSAVCATATSCLAGGTTSTTVSALVPAKGALLQSEDGGRTWTASVQTPTVDDIFGIDCPSSRVCVAVGTDWMGTPPVGTGAVARSSDGGSSFTAVTTEYTPLALTALACPTPGNCVAVGGDTVARITLPVLTPVTPAGGHQAPRETVPRGHR